MYPSTTTSLAECECGIAAFLAELWRIPGGPGILRNLLLQPALAESTYQLYKLANWDKKLKIES